MDFSAIAALIWNVIKIDCEVVGIGLSISAIFFGGIIAFAMAMTAICWLVVSPFYILRGERPPTWQRFVEIMESSGES